MTGFADLYAQLPQFRADYAPPWGLPTPADFQRIHTTSRLCYPAAFIEFQTAWARRLPVFAQEFRWANPGLEPYASLDSLIEDAQALGLAGFAPFADDNGDLIGFLTDHPQRAMDAPVARYELAYGTFDVEAGSFIDWLRGHYLEHARMIGRGEG